MPEGRVYAEDEQLAVRQALEELLAWPPMARSPRLSAFLSYIVDAALTGRSDSVKAYSIAVDVFGREENFDPQSDPIVRVQARRLRGLIEEYDKLDLGSASMRIVLPVGRYVPDFVPREDSRPAVGTEGAGQRRRWDSFPTATVAFAIDLGGGRRGSPFAHRFALFLAGAWTTHGVGTRRRSTGHAAGHYRGLRKSH